MIRWLWLILALNTVNSKHQADSSRTLTCIAPHNTTFYINGNQLSLKNAAPETILSSRRYTFKFVTIPNTLQIIGIQSYANSTPTRIIASTEDNHILTNSTWKCTNQTEENWTNVGYNDSHWSNASIILNDSNKGDISTEAQWIWTNDTTSKNVYCRLCISKVCTTKSLTRTTRKENFSRTRRSSSFSQSVSPVTITKPTTIVTSRVGTTIPDRIISIATTRVVSTARSISSDVTYHTNATKSAEGMNSTHQNAANTGAIIGGVLGAFGLILLIALLLFIVCFIKRRNKPAQQLTKSTSVENEYHEFTPMDVESTPDQTLSHGETPVGRRNGMEGHHEFRNLNRLTLDPSRTHTNGHVIAAKKDSILYSNSNGHSDTYDNFVDTNGTATVVANDDTILVDNDLYGGDSRVVMNNTATYDGVNDDTIVVDNDLYGDDSMVVNNNATSDVVSDDTILVDNDLYGNTEN